MKKIILEKILAPYLAWCAKKIIIKNKPLIIGVTGSIGKSSTKEAIYCVLKERFRVQKSQGNLNNEIGLPLSIIGSQEPKGDILKWFGIIFRSFFAVVRKNRRYPKILVLEMAVDRPGDMSHLVSFAPPKIAVITNIGPTHFQFFKDEKKILNEKLGITKNIAKDGLVVINFDNPPLRSFAKNSNKPILSYGFRPGADILGTEVKIGYSNDLGEGVNLAKGTRFRANYKTIFLPVDLLNIISKAQVYSALAATAVGIHLGMNLVEISRQLKDFQPLPGRMKLLRGKGGNIIVDDTYNAAPNSVKSALEVMALVKSRKKTVILGDMLELGSIEESAHRELARLIFPIANKVILAGRRTLTTHRELRKLGFPKDKIHHFHTVTSLTKKLNRLIGKGEVILVKGSQGMRMEKVVELLIPKNELKYLARQDKYWRRKAVEEV